MAKSDGETTLFDHLLECASISSEIVDRAPFGKDFREQLKEDLLFCALVHDVGKSASGFQNVMYKQAKNWGDKRHEILSASFAATFANVKEEQLFAILTHHRSIFPDLVTMYEKTLPSQQIIFKNDDDSKPICIKMQDEWYERANDLLQIWNRLCKEVQKHEWILSGVPQLSDIGLSYEWLDRSSVRGQIKTIPTDKRKYASLLRGALISSDHLSSAKISRLPSSIVLKEYDLFNDDEIAYPFQIFSSKVLGDAILRAPTGSGKTKAALSWAAFNQIENGRLFYILPYTASINAMFDTLKKIYGEDKVGLLHYKNISHLYSLQEGASNETKQAKLLADLARELYYPIKVCTPHQILRSALRGRGWEQSLIEFPGACFVFDEIHAYEPRILGLIFAMARWLKSLGAKIMFISATMPFFLQNLITKHLCEKVTIIEPDPNEQLDKEILVKKRHVLKITSGDIFNSVETCINYFPDKKILIICNHVSTAQSIYEHLTKGIEENRFNIENPVLLHSRFNQLDRSNIEKLILKEQPKILIATQVIEVSLNLDYNLCITEPAPIDALIQRFGRVNRYGSRDPEFVFVCRTQVNKHKIYEESIVEKTIQYLERLQETVLTERNLIEVADLVYASGYNDAQQNIFDRALNYSDLKDFDETMIAGVYRDWVEDIIEDTDQSIEVLPNALLKKYDELRKNNQWIEADMLLVPIRITQFCMLRSNGYIDPVLDNKGVFLINAPYDSKIGLRINKIENKVGAVFI